MHCITVYCSSSPFLDPVFHAPAQAVGTELGRRGIRLVYGGGGVGLMGDVARASKAAGGAITGIITHLLVDNEQAWDGCDELIVVDSMRERKRGMIERADAFLILPGGLGTYEEFFEVLTGRLLNEHQQPIGILNIDGYYDPMLEMIRHGIAHRFIKPAVLELLRISDDPIALIDALVSAEQIEIDHARFLPSGDVTDA